MQGDAATKVDTRHLQGVGIPEGLEARATWNSRHQSNQDSCTIKCWLKTAGHQADTASTDLNPAYSFSRLYISGHPRS